MKKINFVIPYFNEQKLIAQCLKSIYQQVVPPNYEFDVTLVNDNTSKENLNYLLEDFSSLKLVANEKNIGPGASRNIGAAQGDGEYLVFIDSDVVLKENWLKHTIDFMDWGDYAGGQGSVVPVGDSRLDWFRSNYTAWITKSSFNYLYSIYQSLKTPGVNSSACVYRRDWFEKVGGFNESLRRLEDRDLSTRIFMSGGILTTIPTSEATVYYTQGRFLSFLKRYFKSGKSFPRTSMAKIKTFSIESEKSSKPISFAFYETLARMFFTLGKLASEGEANLKIEPTNYAKNTFIQSNKGQLSPMVRMIKLDETIIFIHLLKNIAAEVASDQHIKFTEFKVPDELSKEFFYSDTEID